MTYSARTRKQSSSQIPISWIIGATVALLMISGGLWFIVGYWNDTENLFVQWLDEHAVHAQILPGGFHLAIWGWVLVMLIAAAVGFYMAYEHAGYGDFDLNFKQVTPAIAGVVALASFAFGFVAVWDNDKDGARSYEHATTFVVEDLKAMPRSLGRLVDTTEATSNPELCSGRTGIDDHTTCIEEGTFPSQWERRTASATGARTVMSRTSGDVSMTYLMEETLTYLYEDGSDGRWSAIRDGRDRQPLFGVVSWDGSGNQPRVCRFEGEHAINFAFQGKWNKNLHNEIAARYRNLLYDTIDMWGYCDSANQPIVVIPVTEQEGYNNRTTRRAGGVLVIKGSPSGEPTIEHITSVKAGDFPGPVYPTWLVDQQRDAVQWAAGRRHKRNNSFGYEDTSVQAQSGNPGNYLLRSVDDGRLYWVTPMKPRSSESQQLVAFSVTPADEVNRGRLNTQMVYVLPDGDDAIVANLDDLEARVRQSLSETDPGFLSSGGEIVEFLPVDQSTWQVYAERAGRVVYRIDVSGDARIKPKVYNVESGTGGEAPTEPPPGEPVPGRTCDDPDQLSEVEILDCLTLLTEELKSRQAR